MGTAVVVGLCAPDLTRLAAEGQGNLLGKEAESQRAAESLRIAWPDQTYESLAVAALHRAGGLTANDIVYAKRMVERIEAPGRPNAVIRALGPDSKPEVARRLLSKDGTVTLVAVPLSTTFVAPATDEAVAWLQSQAQADQLDFPKGLEVRWAGDALIGRDYMRNVQTSLDRAAVATVVRSAGDDRNEPGDCSECFGMDDPGRMGGLAARRVVPNRPPLRLRDWFLSIRLMAFWGALGCRRPRQRDAGGTGTILVNTFD
jgi:uncharacterized membrane protein YdfJ with MMPL/SSD domain